MYHNSSSPSQANAGVVGGRGLPLALAGPPEVVLMAAAKLAGSLVTAPPFCCASTACLR